MKSLFLLLLSMLLLTTSCVGQKPSSKRKTSSASTGSTDNGTAQEPTFTSSEDIYWYTGQKISGDLNLNQDTQTVVYLRGSEIHTYLGTDNNMSKMHCIVAGFNSTGAKKQLRVRSVPISFYNFETRSQERLLRVDVPEVSLNQSTCDGAAPIIDQNGIQGIDTTDTAFGLSTLCPTCVGTVSSTSISLFSSTGTSISSSTFVSYGLVNLKGVGINVSIKSNFNDPINSCSDSNCKAKGFDCCIEGQCAIDGQMKPNASQEPDYLQALADVDSNPNAFINYPNVYFVCSNPPPATSTPTPAPDPVQEAIKKFNQEKLDYYCLEEGKKTTPDYTAGTCSIATKTNVSSCQSDGGTWTYYCGVGSCSDPQYSTRSLCESFSKVWTTIYPNGEEANGTQIAYETIRSDVWNRCGCQADPFPTDPTNPQCPDFGLKAILDTAGEITSIACDIPQPVGDPTPVQNLDFNMSNRSAPHRFFRNDTGEAIDSVTDINKLKVEPEGTPFSYLDDRGKTDPQNGDFNMNSLIGQFNVELNQALPATYLPVEFDQTYIISGRSGYYTPCPTCAADSWFETFSPHPSSQGGLGLQARAFITNRRDYQNNITNGNYEDTIFGRACWLPPTMLPFSHKANADLQIQRQNRLATQAAMYINGYQRDWFGFNKGALIGSFDGVKWFAIGNGRRITATSNKLFLAINAPFADLAESSSTMVSIVTDQGQDVVAEYDYNPNVGLDDPRQNQGATCQAYHQCNVDSDCVAKLGWEYMCVDTSHYRSRWPEFDIFGKEKAGAEITEATIKTIIQGQAASGSNKRCVYRGAGAPCKANYDTLATDKKKMFTCAPNFYCADMGQSDFNSQVVRTPNALEIILYSQEADVLGRPQFYIGSGTQLPESVKSNLKYNAKIFTSAAAEQTNFGLCRPGKRLGTNSYLASHSDKDGQRRTDYISQIGGCDSSMTTLARVQSCPVFETRDNQTTAKGDYLFPTRDNFNAADPANVEDIFKSQQNSCGSESRWSDSGQLSNTFKLIELDPIQSVASLLAPSLAQDACFRRPGSICHTDLDCAPNALHEEQSVFFDAAHFGGTIAEQKYWQESLICGQAAEKPLFSNTADYYAYDMTKNRCCREVGKEISMYTQLSGAFPTSFYSDMNSGNSSLDLTIDVNNPAVDLTSATGRYSRYRATSADPTQIIDDILVPEAIAPIISITGGGPGAGTFNSPAYQWKAVNDTAKLTCCGGGWVRKFADGSHDWSNRTRLNINPTDLKCLNYSNDLVLEQPNTGELDLDNYFKDFDRYCLSPADGGCAQIAFSDPNGYDIVPPSDTAFNGTVPFTTSPTEAPTSGSTVKQQKLPHAPFMPIPYANTIPLHDPTSTFCNVPGGPFNYMLGGELCANTSFYLPSYVGGLNNIKSISVEYFDKDANPLPALSVKIWDSGADLNGYMAIAPETDMVGAPTAACNTIRTSNPAALAAPQPEAMWTICKDPTNTYDVFHIKAKCDSDGIDNDGNTDGSFCNDDGTAWDYAGVRFEFKARNTDSYLYGTGAGATNTAIKGMMRGNDLYYLTKLGRLELLGIPQISYEPLACNSDRSKHVPNIYNNVSTMADFQANSYQYDQASNNQNRELVDFYSDDATALSRNADESIDYNGDGNVTAAEQRVILGDQATNGVIFDSNQFLCCAQLGEKVSVGTRCCSNFATGDDSTKTCALPSGTDLSVYFNRFVSGDGVGETQPGGGLVDTDFVPETGEPKLNASVYGKLTALGNAYCQNNKTRHGGAFGYYLAEPNNGFYIQDGSIEDSKYYSIVDSLYDDDAQNGTGNRTFLDGYRWDHHVYCE